VPVEHLVVDDDDVGEAVDRVTVTLDHGRDPLRRPDPGLAGPVGLDDVRYDDQQRVRVRRLGSEQCLCRLAQTGLVGQQEGAVPGRGGCHELCLVRHQLPAAGELQGVRLG
jgi:hypothetical protein